MVRRPLGTRRTTAALVAGALCAASLAGCATASRAAHRPASSPTPSAGTPAAVAPLLPPGLDGTSGGDEPSVCTALDRAAVARDLGGTVTARPHWWNDGGVPSLDLCGLVLTRSGSAPRLVVVGVTALPAQPDSLSRLASTLGSRAVPAPDVGPDALAARFGAVFTVDDRVVRVTAEHAMSTFEAAAVARAVRPVVVPTLVPARITDGACQPAGAVAEQFLGATSQLRRDYRVRGGMTCIWGTTDRTVAIVESLESAAIPDDLPEVRHRPPPRPAAIGERGYYLPDLSELVFRQGRRVVRVSAIADPPVPVTADHLIDIVEPVMPLFIR